MLAPAFSDGISDEGRQRMVDTYRRAEAVPKYVRAAIKALEPIVREADGHIVDVQIAQRKIKSQPLRLK